MSQIVPTSSHAQNLTGQTVNYFGPVLKGAHISVNFRCIPQPSTTSWGLASPAWCLLGACCSRRVVVHGRLAPKAHRVTCMTRMVFSTFLYRAFTARIGQDIGGQGQATPDQHGAQTLL